MKVLGLSGSPRQGNTAALLTRMLEGAASQGAQIKNFDLSILNIKPCTHCDACLKDGECNINDDMQTLYREMETADAIILASPLHFMTVTANAKLFIDRCQAIWARKYILGKPPLGDSKYRKGVFVSVAGRKGKHLFDAARITVKALFASLDVSYRGELLIAGVDEAGSINCQPGVLDEAYRMGVCLAGQMEESNDSTL
ncbi:MAG: flavodoxin family protein [Dehalococcoidales bacterium]|jgi:multimeric flavodoxin WrbA|nr:flavodoxin family protein [Dehalococcoidales bacterium]MDX9986514.1 flavodoxin family protein [Dehalococcoidales bacterium]NLE90813.1 flavodoxin family protein [Dehalococcoidales bacterium]